MNIRPLKLLLGLWFASAIGGFVASAAGVPPETDLSGVWWNEHQRATLMPITGTAIPFTARGRDAYTALKASLQSEAGQPVTRDDLRPCLPLGPTRLIEQPYPIQIIQKSDLIVLIYEHNHVFELVYLGEKPDPDRDPAFMGNSVGRWDGHGLEIITTNFKEGTLLDDSGLPHSDQLLLKREIRRSADSRVLEILTTITDPVMYSKPWRTLQRLGLRTDLSIEEYTCGQGPTLETRYTRRPS